jgi:hypothetical protein
MDISNIAVRNVSWHLGSPFPPRPVRSSARQMDLDLAMLLPTTSNAPLTRRKVPAIPAEYAATAP